MFFRYLRRELTGRFKQTILIAVGMALAIALVVVVNSFAAGVKNAQATALKAVYGVGTDITVAATPTAASASGQDRNRFSFGPGQSDSSGQSSVSTSRLTAARGSEAFAATSLAKVTAVSGVKAATGTLKLENMSFSGQFPGRGSTSQGGTGTAPSAAPSQSSGQSSQRSSFDVDSFTVLGVDPTASSVGPLSSVERSSGRALTSSDTYSVVLDSTYAKTASKEVGQKITIGGKSFTIVGLYKSASSDSSTSSDAYIPLKTAQSLSGNTGKINSISVRASSSTQIDSIKSAITKALPKMTVSTQADLASTVSGSLSSAASMIQSLGLWLSIIVLAAVVLLSAMFTISGVSRRTRELGSLKAIGWSNGAVTRQIAGESLVQSLIGGVFGAILGAIAVTVINAIGITLTSGVATGAGRGAAAGAQPSFAGGPGMMGGASGAASSATGSVVLSAPLSLTVVLLAIALAALGGIVAGAAGGLRSARLRPAEALRSIA